MRPLGHAKGCLCPECAADSDWDRELLRSERHHDVLCLVLKQQLHDDGSGPAYGGAVLARMVQVAREAADLAYPPLKAEKTDGWCHCAASPDPHMHQYVPPEEAKP